MFENYEGYGFALDYPDPRKVLLIERAHYGRKISLVCFVCSSRIFHMPSILDIFTAKSGRFRSLTNLNFLDKNPELSGIKKSAYYGRKVGRAVEGFGPIGSYILTGDSYEGVYQKNLFFQKNIEVLLK